MSARLRLALGFFGRLALLLGLLWWGWGLDDARGFLAHPARAGLLLLLLLVAAAALVVCSDVQPLGKGKQVVGRGLLFTWMAFGLLLAWLLPYADRRSLWVFADGDALRYLGLALCAVGLGVRLAAHQSLGKHFSGYVTVQEDHRLVQTGLYSRVRHPLYLGLPPAMAGIVLVFRSWLVIPVALLSVGFVVARIQQEEKLLAEHFGAEFEAYRRRTWRLLPYLY